MTSTTPVIEHLETATRSKLRSTQILTSLSEIVSELVQNSLDAGALQVDVGVDCEEWSCWVRDDGCGITRDGIDALAKGGESGRYVTSKAYALASLDAVSTFGFRGEALASAADLACLEISSRTLQSRQSWSVILKGGECLYLGPSTRWRRESSGTVVCIRDAFYNLPVRRRSHPSPTKTLELVRKDLERTALMFPHASFSLEDTTRSRADTSQSGRVLYIPKTGSTLATFRQVFGRSYAEHVEQVDISEGEMKLEGFFSLEGTHAKSFQFLYINRHPISPCDLHRVIDNQFAASSFAKHGGALDETGETNLPRSTIRRSPRKNEKKPIYVLNLTILTSDVDNCLEPAKATVQLKNTLVASSLLASATRSFLIRRGFLSERRSQHTLPIAYASPRKRRRVQSQDQGDAGPIPSDSLPANQTRSGFVARPVTNASVRAIQQAGGPAANETDEVDWYDHQTGETFLVDTRTGNSYQRRPPNGVDNDGDSITRPDPGRRTLANKTKLPTTDSAHRNGFAVPEWIISALQDNEVYTPTEQKIPALDLSLSVSLDPPPKATAGYNCTVISDSHGHPFSDGADNSTQFTNTDLQNAQIINQVDRKFIACLLPSAQDQVTESRSLVLIDQHAADERVRVETFLKDLCLGFLRHGNGSGVETKYLDPAVPVLLTRYEATRLARSEDYQLAFEKWGFTFDGLNAIASSEPEISDCIDGPDQTYIQILARTVPEVVSQKLLMGEELRELVKGYLGTLETEGLSSLQDAISSEDQTSHWLKALRRCPRGLVDLVNSKACRGAIMFNDTLTLEQCQVLVHRLSKTCFPFQCAHGSTIPIADVVDCESALSLQVNFTDLHDLAFQVFFSNQGNQGILGHASKQQLETVFGVSKDVDVLPLILKDGKEQAGEGIHNSRSAATNLTKGSSVIDTRGAGSRGV
ncbi:hypothetical protein JAAARDRAFT_187743 [Jaapia argillacea MUCL 33604]|uniref:MutL C-terminal dimerisation domain-containing protein n=1 Tax=Jaapia argillacea MUCL 33604 TaxID=933084 RepID=A0A067QP71_9AGAM|nr:hypothetical protein JAAARDRAFT_187743 [Jaapia argillacea MUCL 33604]